VGVDEGHAVDAVGVDEGGAVGVDEVGLESRELAEGWVGPGRGVLSRAAFAKRGVGRSLFDPSTHDVVKERWRGTAAGTSVMAVAA